MGLFSRNKGQQQGPPLPARAAPQAPAPVPLYEPVPAVPPAMHPPSVLLTTSPQPEPSQAQFQQQVYHQTYRVHNQALQFPGQAAIQHYPQQQPHATAGSFQQPTYGSQQHGGSAVAGGAAGFMTAAGTAMAGADDSGGGAATAGGATTSTALLRQAVRLAAQEGKPLTLNFVAQMRPVMANNPYGVPMAYQHPHGPPRGGAPGPALVAAQVPVTPTGWQPGAGQDPYEAIRMPALPDMRDLPAELQAFRDQCATGVRQAVAMITAMEHQLWWERSRRQQAEEDCKVLLAAVQMERGVGEALAGAEERRRAEAAEAAAKLTLAADELPQASEAATTIQKHMRGHRARKEFESHLRDILRGVDPSLDPAALPAAAQSHISHVNARGPPRGRLGLRTLLGEVLDPPSASSTSGPGPGGSLPRDQAEAASYYRRQVDRIGQRLVAWKDAGVPHPDDTSGDPLLADVKQILSGSYPASSAQVIAALIRRCRELQSGLLEAVGELEQAQLTIQGLKDSNSRVAELSGVRAQLEASRQDNLRLAGALAKLRTALAVQSGGGGGGGAGSGASSGGVGAARENPHVAAWYRKAYADAEWQQVPPGGPGGVARMDGPDSAVETWDELRASLPEPVMLPRTDVPGTYYKDLLGLKQDLIMSATQGTPDPLYDMPVPDRSAFLYERDTPLVPMQSPAPLIRETMHAASHLSLHPDIHRQSARPSAPGAGGGPQPPTHAHPQNPQPQQEPGVGTGSYQDLVKQQERLRQQQAELEDMTGGAGSQGGGTRSVVIGGSGAVSFQYNRDTPVVPVYSVLPLIREDEFVRRSISPPREALPPPNTPPLHRQQPSRVATPSSRQPSTNMTTNRPYIRDRVQEPPPPLPSLSFQLPPAVSAAAAVAMTRPLPPPLAHQQSTMRHQ